MTESNNRETNWDRFKVAFTGRAHEWIKISLVLYSIRRLNKISLDNAKLWYIFVLSPLLISRALLHPDEISYRYRSFLLGYTYPECQLRRDQSFSTCREMHPVTPQCLLAAKDACFTSVKRVWRMYLQLYTVHGMAFLVIAKILHRYMFVAPRMKSFKQVLRFEIVNVLRSTAFLAGQTLLQRLFLCASTNYNISLNEIKLYLMAIAGSIPIVFERDFRAQQVNNLVLSHLIIGQLRKKSLVKTSLPLWLFSYVLALDQFSLRLVSLLISIITASVTF